MNADTNLKNILKKALQEKSSFEVVGEQIRFKSLKGLSIGMKNTIQSSKKEFIELLNQEKLLTNPVKVAWNEGFFMPTIQQAELYMIQQKYPEIAVYNIPKVFKVNRFISKERLSIAFQKLVNQHEILKTEFFTENGEVKCRIRDSVLAEIKTLSVSSSEELEYNLDFFIHRPFDLSEAPLLRLSIVESPEETALVFLIHHIIADDYTCNCLLEDFSTLLMLNNTESFYKNSEIFLTMKDYSHWQKIWLTSVEAEVSREYWKNKLSFIEPAIELTTTADSNTPYQGDRHHFILPPGLSVKLLKFAKNHGMSDYAILLTTYSILLHAFFNKDQVAIASAYSNRDEQTFSQTYGFMVNPVLFLSQIDYRRSALELIKATQQQVIELQENKRIPFSQVLAMFDSESVLTMRNFMFDYVVSTQNKKVRIGENVAIEKPFYFKWAKLPLTLFIEKQGQQLKGTLEWQVQFFEKEDIKALESHFILILDQLLDEKSLPEIEFRLPAEIDTINSYNNTSYVSNKSSLIEIFEVQVKIEPDKVAVVDNGTQVTYSELHQRTNQLAAYLQNIDIKPGDVVGIYMDRSLEMFYAIFALLKTGASYLPLDPDYPSERLSYMIKDSAAVLVLTRKLVSTQALKEVKCLNLIDLMPQLSSVNLRFNGKELADLSYAYIIYTSGSTGLPKGVLIQHKNLRNYMDWFSRNFKVTPYDTFDFSTSLSFDLSVTCTLLPLLNGASVIIASNEVKKDPQLYLSYLRKNNISFLKTTPSYFAQMVNFSCRIDLPQLKMLVLGGEALPASIAEAWLSTFPSHYLLNEYGPTETTVAISAWLIHSDNLGAKVNGTFPIGFPAFNTKLYILNKHKKPCPIGGIGEIFISGHSVAVGYQNRPEINKEKFLADPWWPNNIMYKTGDLGSWTKDSGLIYRGRLDQQIKIRGYRVEIGEIIAKLCEVSGVQEAVVINKKEENNTILIAYFVGTQAVDEAVVRERLKVTLPDFMIPHYIIKITAIPLTPNHKADLKSLPDPRSNIVPKNNKNKKNEKYDEVTKQLLKIVESTLKVSGINMDDDFFKLGGDSISCLQLLSKAYDAGIIFRVKDLFEAKTIRHLLPKVNITKNHKKIHAFQGGEVKLLPIQNWFFSLKLTNIHHWNQAIEVTLPDNLNIPALCHALKQLYQHHEVFHTYFKKKEDQWIGYFELQKSNENIVQIQKIQSAKTDDDVARIVMKQQEKLNIINGPLFKGLLLEFTNKAKLFFIAHHLCIDAVSWRILIEDINRLYQLNCNSSNHNIALQKTTSVQQWTNYLASSEYVVMAKQESVFWQDQFKGVLGKLSAERAGDNVEKDATEVISFLSDVESKRLLIISSRLAVLPRDILLLALLRALSDRESAKRWLLSLEHHGRTITQGQFDFSRTIGWFTCMYPLAVNIGETSDVLTQLKLVRQTLESVPNYGRNYQIIQHLTQNYSDIQPEICFNYLGKFNVISTNDEQFTIANPSIGNERYSLNKRPHILDINCFFQGEELKIHWIYNAIRLSEKYIIKLMAAFEYHLELIVDALDEQSVAIKVPADFKEIVVTQKTIDKLQNQYGENFILAPATMIQQGFIYNHLKQTQSGDYLTQLSWVMTGNIDIEHYHQAWSFIYKKYAMLRTAFVVQGFSMPHQIAVEQVVLRLRKYDWSNKTMEQQQVALKNLLSDDRQKGFDITQPSLSRIYLIREKINSWKTIWSYDHTIMDGWSLSLMLADLFNYYEGKIKNWQVDSRFFDYARWLAKSNSKNDSAKNFWLHYLTDIKKISRFPEVNLETTDLSSESYQKFDKNFSEKVMKYTRSHGITTNTVMQGVWAILLSHYSNQKEVLFGVTVSGRNLNFPNIQKMAGMFINTLPLRLNLNEKISCKDWLYAIQDNMRSIAEYEHISIGEISNILNKNLSSFIQTNVVFENYPVEDKILANQDSASKIEHLNIAAPIAYIQSGYPMSLIVIPGNGELAIKIAYQHKKFTKDFVENLQQDFLLVLTDIINGKEKKLGEINQKLKKDISVDPGLNKKSSVISHSFVFEKIENYAKKYPNQLAIEDDQGNKLLYRELIGRMLQLAAHLRTSGIKPNEIVGIYYPRSIEAIIAMLAVNKAGAAYVSIDSSYPQEKIDFIVKDTHLTHVICCQEFSHKFIAVPYILCMPSITKAWNYPAIDFLNTVNKPEDLMYVIYTSGSTGAPKGVMIEHRGISNYVQWASQFFTNNIGSGALIHSSLAFDITITALFPALVSGHSLYVVSESHGVQGLINVIKNYSKHERFSLVKLTPTHLSILKESLKEDLSKFFNVIVVGGESLSKQHLDGIDYSKCSVINHYGPTEATCGCCANLNIETALQDEALSAIPIGKAIDQMRTYILDENLKPVEAGTIGELYIAGPGLARGYINLPEMTNNNFLTLASIGERVYKTGDLVKKLKDGSILFIGRVDHQVKHNGYRIELGEIEAVLLQHGDISRVSVILRGNTPSDMVLVAFVELGEFFLDREEIRNFLKDHLPYYMVPEEIIMVDKMPMTGSGKIDRKLLETIFYQNDNKEKKIILPLSEMEKLVCQTWSRIFDKEVISVNHNFFDLGGHSLRAVQIISQIGQVLEKQIPLPLLFQYPTVSEFAKALELLSNIQKETMLADSGVEL